MKRLLEELIAIGLYGILPIPGRNQPEAEYTEFVIICNGKFYVFAGIFFGSC
jgi:hypothetical protein